MLGRGEDRGRVVDRRRSRRAAHGRSAAPCAGGRSLSVSRCSAMSSRNCRRMREAAARRASTSASPSASISARGRREQVGDVGGVGRARRWSPPPSLRELAARPPAPPRRRGCGRSGAGRRLRFARSQSAAATRSSTLEEKLVLANSPSLAPSPVKSKRSTAMPRSASALAIAPPRNVLGAGEAVGEQGVGARLATAAGRGAPPARSPASPGTRSAPTVPTSCLLSGRAAAAAGPRLATGGPLGYPMPASNIGFPAPRTTSSA